MVLIIMFSILWTVMMIWGVILLVKTKIHNIGWVISLIFDCLGFPIVPLMILLAAEL
jgi:hypothetical protein